jgi:HSP20 family molecular chaperone IbpA
MYTLTAFDNLLNELTRQPLTTPTRTYGTFEVDVLEDGKQSVTINTLGHNPKDITVDVTDEEVTIVAKKKDGTSRFVKDIDLTLTVGKDYDGTKTEAKFENGLLVLTIDKKINKKAKSLKISY